MTFRMDKQHEILAKHPGANHKDISKLVGEMWRAAPEHVKEHYRKRAEQGRKMHMMQYPDYKYSPTQRRKETAAKKKGISSIVNNGEDYGSDAGSPAGSGTCSPALSDGTDKVLDPVALGSRLAMIDSLENDLPASPPLLAAAATPSPPQELSHLSDFNIFTAWRDTAVSNSFVSNTDAFDSIFAADSDETSMKTDLKIIVDEPFNTPFTDSLFGDSPFTTTATSSLTSTPMCLSPATLKTLELLTEPYPATIPLSTTTPHLTTTSLDSKPRDFFLPPAPRNLAPSAPSPLRHIAKFPRLNTQSAISANDLDDLADKFWSLPSPSVDAFWGVGCASGLTPRTPRTPGTGLRGMFMLPLPSEV
ncbi:hypothetical protein HK097_000281 [Rhizophlyctis rosea]|uniref:HMG box domain-containing protein n=1 Tax=Rhizophlyctis rosea TaxID=64517 RepID=A0AAD5S5S9_9FUNG|nr:hypothetical protein HK097_000281 [Rhizophlyctis rosea]